VLQFIKHPFEGPSCGMQATSSSPCCFARSQTYAPDVLRTASNGLLPKRQQGGCFNVPLPLWEQD